LESKVWDLGFGVLGFEFEVQELWPRFEVKGSGFRVQSLGSGCRG